MTPVIQMQGVSKSYHTKAGTVVAAADLSLVLEPGQITGVMGPSGSGKTTLLNLIVGWEKPDHGKINRESSVKDDWSGVTVIPQGIGLLDELDVAGNIVFPSLVTAGLVARVPDPAPALGLTALLGRKVGELSLGEQQRVAVARAVSYRTRLIVADEPTAHQDEGNVRAICGVIVGAASDGAAVLVTSHDDRVLEFCHQVIHMTDGRFLG